MNKNFATNLLAAGLLLAAASANAADQCAATFEEFLAKFAASADYQAANTKFPLVYRHAASAADTNIVEETIADAAGYKAVQFPSAEQQKAQGLTSTSSKDRGGATTIRLTKADGESTQYRFFKTETCWQLIRMEKGAVTTQAPPVFKPFGEQ